MFWGGGHLLVSLASWNKSILSTPISTPTSALTSTVISVIKLSLVFIFSFSLGFIVYSELSPTILVEADNNGTYTITPGVDYSVSLSSNPSIVDFGTIDSLDNTTTKDTSLIYSTNCPAGYTVYVSSTDPYIRHTDTNLVNTQYIKPITPDLINNTSSNTIPSNTWGISLDNGASFFTPGVDYSNSNDPSNPNDPNNPSNPSNPLNPNIYTILDNKDENSMDSTLIDNDITLNLKYAINPGEDLLAGKYKTKLNYSIIAKPACQSYTLKLDPNHTSRNGSNVTIGSASGASKATITSHLTHRGEATNLSSIVSTNNWYRKGYTLDSFNTKADGTGISYLINASTVLDESSIVHTILEQSLTNNTGTGNTGTGNTSSTISSTTDSTTYTSSLDILTLYAIWKPIDYTISYTMNSGTTSQTLRTTYNVESSAYTIPTATRSGYVFSGWTGTGLTEATMSPTIAKGAIGNKAYTANFRQTQNDTTYPEHCHTGNGYCFTIGDIPANSSQYVIFVDNHSSQSLQLPTWTVYNSQDDLVWYNNSTNPAPFNNGCGTGGGCSNGAWIRGGKIYHTALILNKNDRTGYIATHVYLNNGVMTNATALIGGNAVYRVNHNLNYNANGGSGGKSVNYTSGVTGAARRTYDLSYKCTRSGYTQIGYSLSSAASSRILSAKTVYWDHVTVYAQWVRTSATVN